MTRRKTTEEFIVDAICKHEYKYNYSLVNYINSNVNVKIICHVHGVFEQTPRKHLCGSGCRFCANNIKRDINFIKDFAVQKGYVCVSNTYIAAHSMLSFICPRGHPFQMKWNNFQQGQECCLCYYENSFGETNPNWKGGISLKPYCTVWSNKSYKKEIKERDNYICQNPYCFKTDNLINIHHIDYNKKNCHPSNLITVCRACNSRANTFRDWHKEWYQTIMSKRFNYKY